jgi:hypothetical protein
VRRRRVLAGLALVPLALAARPARAAPPLPEGFSFEVGALSAVRAAISRKSLPLLSIGSALVNGGAAHDPELTYPARLAARLGKALPGVEVHSTLLPIARARAGSFHRHLVEGLHQHRPALVVWGAGGIAAARGDDLESFHAQLAGAIEAVHAAGADMILMTPQYAPSLATVLDLPPYHMAILQEAEAAGVPVLDRYELMRFWSANAILDLDSTTPAEQVTVARTLYDWVAELLAEGILHGLR